MEEIKQIPARAEVKVTTSWGRICLHEIQGLKEGSILDGLYTPINKAFDFTWNDKPAMLWIGDNGRLVILGEGQRHKYMMLDRLRTDCMYFLDHPSKRNLYFPDIARHMKEMRQYWKELNIKPDWLSYEQIGRLEHKMNQRLTRHNRHLKRA